MTSRHNDVLTGNALGLEQTRDFKDDVVALMGMAKKDNFTVADEFLTVASWQYLSELPIDAYNFMPTQWPTASDQPMGLPLTQEPFLLCKWGPMINDASLSPENTAIGDNSGTEEAAWLSAENI